MSSNMTAIMEMDPFVLTRSTGAIVVPLLAIVALLLDIPCFAWHLKNRNLPASCLVFWIILANLFNFINALVWPTDDIPNWYQGQGYCDLEVKLDIAATFGIPAAVICVMKSLAQALNTDKIVLHPSASQRRRKIIIECLLCFGLPAYVIAIHYVVQPTRYYIFAIAGCTPSFDNSWPSIALVYIWPMALCLVGGYYAILLIIRLHKYRTQFKAILSSGSSGLNSNRFIRLFCVSLLLLVIFLPVQGYVVYREALFPLQPYSWSAIHGPDWNSIILVPSFGEVVFDRWIRISLGFTVFVCFGLGQEAVATYRLWLLKIGLGRVFPGLNKSPQRNHVDSSSSSRPSSFGSKAQEFIRKFSMSHESSLGAPSPREFRKQVPRLPSIHEGGTGFPNIDLSAPTATQSTVQESSSRNTRFVPFSLIESTRNFFARHIFRLRRASPGSPQSLTNLYFAPTYHSTRVTETASGAASPGFSDIEYHDNDPEKADAHSSILFL